MGLFSSREKNYRELKEELRSQKGPQKRNSSYGFSRPRMEDAPKSLQETRVKEIQTTMETRRAQTEPRRTQTARRHIPNVEEIWTTMGPQKCNSSCGFSRPYMEDAPKPLQETREELNSHSAGLRSQNVKEFQTMMEELRSQSAEQFQTMMARLNSQSAKQFQTLRVDLHSQNAALRFQNAKQFQTMMEDLRSLNDKQFKILKDELRAERGVENDKLKDELRAECGKELQALRDELRSQNDPQRRTGSYEFSRPHMEDAPKPNLDTAVEVWSGRSIQVY